jgi:hypothetical protein
MRENCSSGTVRGGDGDVPTYSAEGSPLWYATLGGSCQQERTPRYMCWLSCLVFAHFTIQLQTVGGDDMATGIGAVASDRTLQPTQLALNGNP